MRIGQRAVRLLVGGALALAAFGLAAWLAPASMGWQGRSRTAICAQVKDPAPNGGHALAEIVEHMAQDSLVGWAWSPGVGREPAPGTQEAFGALIKAWADAGAVCPGG